MSKFGDEFELRYMSLDGIGKPEIMSDTKITIELLCTFATEERGKAVIEAAQIAARELFAKTAMMLANDKLGKPRIKLTSSTFFTDEVEHPIMSVGGALADAADDEDPFA